MKFPWGIRDKLVFLNETFQEEISEYLGEADDCSSNVRDLSFCSVCLPLMIIVNTFRSARGIGCLSDHFVLNKAILQTNCGENDHRVI